MKSARRQVGGRDFKIVGFYMLYRDPRLAEVIKKVGSGGIKLMESSMFRPTKGYERQQPIRRWKNRERIVPRAK